jgi:hypothetical protein
MTHWKCGILTNNRRKMMKKIFAYSKQNGPVSQISAVQRSKSGERKTNQIYQIYSFNNHFHRWHFSRSLAAIMAQREVAKEDLLMTGRSISRPTSSRSLKPSMSGMWTSLITRSNWSLFSLSSFKAVAACPVVVTATSTHQSH